MKKILFSVILLFMCIDIFPYKVYITTGHKCKGEFSDVRKFSFCSENIDGLWCMPWNFRTNYLSDDDISGIVRNFKSKDMVVEIEMRHFKGNGEPIQLRRALQVGADVHTLMIYNENSKQGSMLTQSDVDYVKGRYGDKYKLVTNIRLWNEKVASQIIRQLDGCSFEFNAGDSTLNARKVNVWKDVVKAVKWCVDNDKTIYLLTPPGHLANMTPDEIREKYATGYPALLKYLLQELGKEIMSSDNVVFVPSNYNFDKRPVHLVPESDPKTVTGVCKYLLLKENSL